MRIDSAGAPTAVLAAAALWAVLVWALALAGLGGRIAPLPDDPALVQALPDAAAPAGERLGPLPQYAEIGARPLFAEDRRHRPFVLDGSGEDGAAAPGFDMVLTSVLITPTLEMAIVQPREGGEPLRVRVGESPRGFGNWTLDSLAPRSASFTGPEGQRILELRVFDGVGGQPPTPVAPPQPQQPTAQERLPAPPSPGQARAQEAAQAAAAAQQQPARQDAAGAEGAREGAEPATPASQAEAIRRRIEARRARLRAEQAAQQQNP